LTSNGVRGGHRQQGDVISLLLFFQNKESGLKGKLPNVNTKTISIFKVVFCPEYSEAICKNILRWPKFVSKFFGCLPWKNP
jgi:hypothetical protein